MRTPSARPVWAALLLWAAIPAAAQVTDLRLPLLDKSIRFAVIGDGGTGLAPQYEVARLMAQYHQKFPFDFVLMLGDNIYGGHSPADLKKKFDDPYQPLLQAGVKFYASLGNHDDPAIEMNYKPFNMKGKRYYDFKSGNAHFFALDSDYMDPDQLTWLQQTLSADDSSWKLAFFHHPLYDHAKFHGADPDLRAELEPIFIKSGVNVVLSGHEHVYERIKPQHGIYYFVLGNSGQLRFHDLNASPEIVKGFDTDRDFMLVEISGDQMYIQTISRSGETVDSDVLKKQPRAAQ